MLFNKLLYKLNLITEKEYNEDILNSLDDEEFSMIDAAFILLFFTVLFVTGSAWMNML